ncbi:aminopeptidase [Candidatus Woesearchaeota archaeon]|nr:aminopeptidase [Candidatus Woesearchaeota archaeon]
MNDTTTKHNKTQQKIDLKLFKKIIIQNLNATNEKILIIGDKGYKNNTIATILTEAYTLAAKELNKNYETIYQNFKGRGDQADEILIKKLKEIPNKSILIINVSNRIGKLGNLGLSFRKYAKEKEHKFISSSSLGSIKNENLQLILNCLDIDYKEIEKQTNQLAKKLTNAKKIQITTKAGTNIEMNVEGIQAKTATGIYKNPGEGGNLPGSEAYIAPKTETINGIIIIDGSARLKDETILIKEPIKLQVTKGIIKVINNTPEAQKLKKTLQWAHNKSLHPENVWKIGELGIGLNKKAKIIGSTIIDEKTYNTCHFAIGSNNWFGGDIKSIIHLDQVIKNPTIKIDGKIIEP